MFHSLRSQFPALARRIGDREAVFLDGPGGTQVPRRVIDAVSGYLAHSNANHGGPFATSRESDEIIDDAHRALAALLGARDPGCVVFGPNMTSLTFALSRAIARTWRAGDEILVTRLDHDANVAPWVLAARDAGATVKIAEIRREDCTLDLDDLRAKLSDRTRLVAAGCASNATGGINPVREICRLAREAGALSFLDAVHFAPHASIDVEQLGCDFLACSAYKFFGPHVGVLWGRRELLEEIEAYKVRPAPREIPEKWMTGTQNHEGIAGAAEAVRYLADLGRAAGGDDDLADRPALAAAFAAIGEHERSLAERFLAGAAEISEIQVWGITDRRRISERLPTFSITHKRLSSGELAQRLADEGFFVYSGNYYALSLTEALGLEPQGMVRIGIVHYNIQEEIDRLLSAIRRAAP